MVLVKIQNEFYEDGFTFTQIDNVFFHPQGGGQPNDKLVDKYGNDIKIKKNEDKFFLGVNENSIENGYVEIDIDMNFNFLCSRLHSAGHLLAMITEKTYNITPIKAHHFPNEAYIKFKGELNKEKISELENLVNFEILSNRKVKESKNENGRFIEFEGIHGYNCGGTHVNNLGEISKIKLDSISVKKGMTTIKYSL